MNEVLAPLDPLIGQFLWTLNLLTAIAFIALAAQFALRHLMGQDHSTGGWLIKIVVGLALASGASDIAHVVING